MEDVLPKLDVLYMTRVQKERFFNEDDYIRTYGPDSDAAEHQSRLRKEHLSLC